MGYEDIVRTCIREKKKLSMEMFVDRHVLSTYQWMNLVVHKNFTFSDVDDPTIRSAVWFDSICSNTLKARMNACVELIEPHVTEELKRESGLFWSLMILQESLSTLIPLQSCSWYGLAVCFGCATAVFVITCKGWRFLALSSFLDEHTMTADEHIRFLGLILDQYQLDITNIVAIVCDIIETNKAISRRITDPMIGCAAHRFNLAVKDHPRCYRDTIKKGFCPDAQVGVCEANRFAEKERVQLEASPYARTTIERYSPNVQRYVQLQPFLHLFERDCEVDRCIPENASKDDPRRFPIMQYLPNPLEHYSILELLDDMEIPEVATKRLQERNLTLLSARDILDETIVAFPDLEDLLRGDANIVESPAFETGMVKIMQGIAVARLERTLAEDSSAKRKRNNEHSSSTTVSKKKHYNSPTLSASNRILPDVVDPQVR
ncbi:hypothetical protein P3T76_001792 [Phytophthora citrophthora]|uniref:Uncharacterized protein n=1 Tax=Phytophthora citrophthora TaxID=4793 RepID=A0AAD9LTJ5_9STRA|nr:hypothetical protein P3T76_001792 [Phytophthora citrophthora]